MEQGKMTNDKIDKLKDLKENTSNESLKQRLKDKIEIIKKGDICTK